jgi:hypothetical protein
MAKSRRSRRIGVLLICLGLLLVVAGLGIYMLWVVVGGDEPPPTVDPTVPQQVDLVGIAALITSVGGFIGGILTAVTGLIVVLRKPTKVQGKTDPAK